MPENDKNSALRKKQQIEKAGRNMFLWVAIAAAIVGIAGVVSVSLFERIAFNQKVISAKNKTASILRNNNAIVSELEGNIRLLNTNQALVDTPRLPDSQPVSVILDALPATANSSALGASLQQQLLDGPGVTIDQLAITPVDGVEADNSQASVSSGETATGENQIAFEFTIAARNIDDLKSVLRKLERSIRTINLVSIETAWQSNSISLSAKGVAYYQPEVKVELREEVKKP